MAFYDVETILDEAADLTAAGMTALSKDTGAPHEDNRHGPSTGSSEGHLSYLRLTVTDDIVGAGDDFALVLYDSSDDATFVERARVYLGLDRFEKGKTTKLRIPPKVSRYLQGGWDPGVGPVTGGTAIIDIFHG